MKTQSPIPAFPEFSKIILQQAINGDTLRLDDHNNQEDSASNTNVINYMES